MILFFSAIAYNIFLEYASNFLFLWIFNEFIKFLAVEIEYYAFEILLVDAIFKGEYKFYCLIEITFQHYFSKELDLFAEGG